MNKLDTSHLVLKPVMINGKLQHRWHNPDNDQEFAPFGTKIKFQHHGKELTGTVGSVISTGEYAVKDESGKGYNKHKHQFEVIKEEKESSHGKEKLASFIDEETNVESFIIKSDKGKFHVIVKDLDSGNIWPMIKICDNYEKAVKIAKETIGLKEMKSDNLINTKGDFHVKIEPINGKFEFTGKLPIELKVQRKNKDNKIYWGSPIFDTKEAAEKRIELFNERQAKETIEAEKFNKDSNTEERILKGFKSSIKGYPVINDILKQSIPHLEKIVKAYKQRAEDQGRVFTAGEQEAVEIALLSDLVGSLGNYIAKTDEAKNIKFKETKGTVAITADIIRDGKPNHFSTQMIYAGGHTVQVLHFRYIVDTKLPHRFNVPLVAIEAKIKHIKASEKIKEQIQTEQNLLERYENDIKKLESKTKSQSDQEEIEYRIKNKFPLKFEDVNKESHAYKAGKEAFEQKLKEDKDRRWERIQTDLKSAKRNIKEITNKKAKLEKKLKDHIEQEVKYENPNEGDTKIERGKKDFRNEYPVHIHEFKDGNWKKIRSTTVANIRKHGFKSTEDSSVLAYHERRKSIGE